MVPNNTNDTSGAATPIALPQIADCGSADEAPSAVPQQRACNACQWQGETDRMCGSVGPLCPECGETTEYIEPPTGLSDAAIMKLFDLANTPTTVTTAHSPWHQEILVRFARLLLAASAPQSAPNGYKVVPFVPTDAMIYAGHHKIDYCRNDQNTCELEHESQTEGGIGTTCKQDVMEAFAAMLSAAPDGFARKAQS